jgi:hypothetical protein
MRDKGTLQALQLKFVGVLEGKKETIKMESLAEVWK